VRAQIPESIEGVLVAVELPLTGKLGRLEYSPCDGSH
jgi:hypothetical protein